MTTGSYERGPSELGGERQISRERGIVRSPATATAAGAPKQRARIGPTVASGLYVNHERFYARVMRQAGFATEAEAAVAARAVLGALGDEICTPERLSRPGGMVIHTLASELSPDGRHLLVAVLPNDVAEVLIDEVVVARAVQRRR